MDSERHALCGRSELEYSPAKLIQNEIDYAYTTEVSPQNSIMQGNNIKFHIEGGPDFVDLANTHLIVEIKLVDAAGEGVDDTKLVCPVNNILHSLWSQEQVTLKNTDVSHPSQTYPFRPYLENLISYSRDSKTTWMKNQGWYFDQAGKFDAGDNTALRTRRATVLRGKTLRLKGKLSTDVGNQPLLIPSLVDVKFTLSPSKPEFVILKLDEDDAVYNIEIRSAKLSVRMVKLHPEAVVGFERTIARAPINIPVQRVEITTESITGGGTSYTKNAVFNGPLPNYLVIGFLNNVSQSGTYDSNPFNFAHHDLNFIQLKVNDRLVPTQALEPNYDEDEFVGAYESIYNVIGKLYTDWSNGIEFADFKGGSALYGFDLSQDTLCRHDNKTIYGSIDVVLRFGNPLPDTTTMLVYSVRDSNIQIDQHRNVILDKGA